MNKDFGDEMSAQVDEHHEWIIDNAPRVILTDGKRTIIAAKIEVGEDRIVEYWCPEEYCLIDVPKDFVASDLLASG